MMKEQVNGKGDLTEVSNPADCIGRNVLNARIRLSLSQSDLADRAGMGRAVLSRIETGKVIPSIQQLYSLAHALKTGYETLLSPLDLPPDGSIVWLNELGAGDTDPMLKWQTVGHSSDVSNFFSAMLFVARHRSEPCLQMLPKPLDTPDSSIQQDTEPRYLEEGMLDMSELSAVPVHLLRRVPGTVNEWYCDRLPGIPCLSFDNRLMWRICK